MEQQDTLYNEGFIKGFSEGRLIGKAMGLLVPLGICKDMGQDADILLDKLPKNTRCFLEEMMKTMEKYPNHSDEYIARRAIFEATYLPYDLEEVRAKKVDMPKGGKNV